MEYYCSNQSKRRKEKNRKMKRTKDAFGQGLLEYMRTGEAGEMFERDDGKIFRVDKSEYFTSHHKWSVYQKAALRHARGRVLDIGCGAGRHAIYLQGKGFDVLGIDNSSIAIGISMERGLKKALVLPIGKLSPKTGTFDTILMLGQNFGLFQSAAKLKKILNVMDRMMPPDGVIIAESLDPRSIPDWDQKQYSARNKSRSRLAGQVTVRVITKHSVGEWFDYLFVSKSEMEHLLEGTAWKVKKFYGDKFPTYAAIIVKKGI
jgi:2-polyprenyl-3-methyl-5-hydroxy-6-metoxy-1,4-benzoquinol methylase